MRVRQAACIVGLGLAAGLMVVPPRDPSVLATPSYTVHETGAVSFGPGIGAELGTRVDGLRGSYSAEAYDPAARTGMLQYRGPSGNAVLLLVVDGVVRAVSVGYEPAFRTREGVGLGDPEELLKRVYGDRLRTDGDAAGDLAPLRGYAVAAADGTMTLFDTSCTRRVNAIALVQGRDGLRALSALWRPAAGSDVCLGSEG